MRSFIRALIVTFAALGMSVAVASAHGFAAGIDWGQAHTEFDVGGTNYSTHITETGVEIGHWWYGRKVLVALRGGYLGVTENQNPALSGLNVEGYYAGLGARTTYPLFPSFGLTLGLDGTYHRASDTVGARMARIRWFDLLGRVGAWYRYGIARASAGLVVRRYSGSVLATYPVASDLSIPGKARAGAYLGLSFYTGARSRVAAFADIGAYSAYTVSFRYGF
jgi:hypothetical protein